MAKTETQPKVRPPTRAERLDEQVQELAARAKLDSWNSFIETLKIPRDLLPAFATGRPELIAAATPRALTADECAILYRLIGGLLDTNAALREHAETVALLVHNWGDQFTALRSVGNQIERFANFKRIDSEGDDDGS